MPGIFGVIGGPSSVETMPQLEVMRRRMRHEPFYNSGIVREEKLGLGAGWVAHAGSFSDCLPAWNRTRDVCLLFTGEHFGGADEPVGNAAQLVQLYERHGASFYERLNGSFSGLIVDLRRNEVTLFNDRYGLGRLYCHETGAGFYFASEAKALLAVLPQTRQLEPQGLGEFFSCGCVLQDRSIFAGLSLVPGASAWTFRPGETVHKTRYFDPDAWESQPALPAAEYYGKMNAIFTRILPHYLRSGQSLSLSLTGGLDSRMIVAGASPAPGTLPCHTFGGMYRECADVRLARRIARACGQTHEVIPVTAKFFSEFPDLVRRSIYYSDGTMDVTGAVELFANRFVREHSPVRLTGNYGSEILRGNIAFKPRALSESIYDPAFAPAVRNAATTYARERTCPRPTFIAFKQVPWFHYARQAVEQSQLTVRSPFLDNQLVAVSYQAPPEVSTNQSLAHRYIAEHHAAVARIPTDRGAIGRGSSGKFEVFCREFMPRAEYVFDYGMPQWLAKVDRWTSPLHVERLFLGRQKFYHFRTWYRHELAGYVKEVLLDPRSLGRSYLNRRRIAEIVAAHTSGRGNYTLEIHKLLSIEMVQRELLEQN